MQIPLIISFFGIRKSKLTRSFKFYAFLTDGLSYTGKATLYSQ
jgi:hypothetical protein